MFSVLVQTSFQRKTWMPKSIIHQSVTDTNHTVNFVKYALFLHALYEWDTARGFEHETNYFIYGRPKNPQMIHLWLQAVLLKLLLNLNYHEYCDCCKKQVKCKLLTFYVPPFCKMTGKKIFFVLCCKLPLAIFSYELCWVKQHLPNRFYMVTGQLVTS